MIKMSFKEAYILSHDKGKCLLRTDFKYRGLVVRGTAWAKKVLEGSVQP